MNITRRKIMKTTLFLLCTLIVNIAVINLASFDVNENLELNYNVKSETPDYYQVFYGENNDWNEEKSLKQLYSTVKEYSTLQFNLPANTQTIRVDFGENDGSIHLSDMVICYLWNTIDISDKLIENNSITNDIKSIEQVDNNIVIERMGKDPYIEIRIKDVIPKNWFYMDYFLKLLFKICVCMALNLVIFIFVRKKNVILSLLKEIYANRQLIWGLSKNDFKTKYAGSYLGITWAFVQPVVTVLVYWFVFQVGFRSAPIDNFPFVLWLVAGIVPWFFFAEALMNATNSMIEYSYLVKKVVFKISILPVVKILSAFFVHAFFALFTVGLFAAYGYMPTLYTIQIIYYTVCVWVLVLGISYTTSAVVIFFKDLGQVIGILLQVGVWMTPIMWSYTMIPTKYQWIFKLNPMYYIVEGYRDSLINGVWFWERFNQTIYFWIVVVLLLGIGTLIFKRLKIHFADVL